MSDKTFRDLLRAFRRDVEREHDHDESEAALVAYVDGLRRERDAIFAEMNRAKDDARAYWGERDAALARAEAAEAGWHLCAADIVRETGRANAAEVRAEAAERALVTAQGEKDALLASLDREVKARAEAEEKCDASIAFVTEVREALGDDYAGEEAHWRARSIASIQRVRSALASARRERNEILRFMQSAEAAYAGSDIIREVIGFLEAAGCGKPGTPNTLWAMTQEIVAREAAAWCAGRDAAAAVALDMAEKCEETGSQLAAESVDEPDTYSVAAEDEMAYAQTLREAHDRIRALTPPRDGGTETTKENT